MTVRVEVSPRFARAVIESTLGSSLQGSRELSAFPTHIAVEK